MICFEGLDKGWVYGTAARTFSGEVDWPREKMGNLA